MVQKTEQIMVCGDFNDVAMDMVAGTVDLIYTDPPYGRQDTIPSVEMLVDHAPRLLKDGGSLVTNVPHILLEEVMAMFREEEDRSKLKYRWIYNMDQEAGSRFCTTSSVLTLKGEDF